MGPTIYDQRVPLRLEEAKLGPIVVEVEGRRFHGRGCQVAKARH